MLARTKRVSFIDDFKQSFFVTTHPRNAKNIQAKRGCGGLPWKVWIKDSKRLAPCLCIVAK